jgi:hypothetical protein
MSDVYILIDSSWSMKDIKEIVLKDVNEYISKKPHSTRFSVYFFNQQIDRPIIRKQCVYLTDDMYEIWGRSALYDAIDITLRDASHRSTGPCTIAIYTDGYDTASIYCSHSQIDRMIEHYKSSQGYTFDFIYRDPFKKKKKDSWCCLFRNLRIL